MVVLALGVTLAFGRLRKENQEFKGSLSYINHEFRVSVGYMRPRLGKGDREGENERKEGGLGRMAHWHCPQDDKLSLTPGIHTAKGKSTPVSCPSEHTCVPHI